MCKNPLGGAIFPDQATMYLCAIEDAEYRHEKVDFWKDVYGYDMSCIGDWVLKEPLVDVVQGAACLCKPVAFKEINLLTVRQEDLAFQSGFRLVVEREEHCHALVGYFDIGFNQRNRVHFSTGPHAKYTHWKQTVFYLEHPIALSKGDVLEGRIAVSPNQGNHRETDIHIDFSLNGNTSTHTSQSFHMC